ncbi:hypothetical protein JW848_11040 [Candidatus Bipolaricaulota bacterium]|nr:hypothetical protein [Candidatus Bipolaricaulota bacterium]
MLQLKPLGLQHGIHEIEHIKTDTFAVRLCEDVADLSNLKVLIKLNVNDLVLIHQALELLAK